MTRPEQSSSVKIDEARLRTVIEEILGEALQKPVKIRELKQEASPFATLFPADILKIDLEGGKQLSLFLKHLGNEQSDHPEKLRRDREVKIYEQLLADDSLPVVKYYGSKWNETTNRCEVFLEYINDWNLKYHDLEHWFTAARRLAHLHAYFAKASDKLHASDFLLRIDASYFNEWAERALSEVADQSDDLANRLKLIVSRYDRAVDVILQQPRTLVHNDPSPKNVLADRSTKPARICFVDWEMAGVGCGVLDLVHLKYGLDSMNDQKMCDTYCAELSGTGLLPEPVALASLIAACELHKTIYRLAFSRKWKLSVEKVARWIGEAEVFSFRV